MAAGEKFDEWTYMMMIMMMMIIIIITYGFLCIGRAGRDVGVYGVCVCVCFRERERERNIIEESFTNYRSRRCWISFKAGADLKAFVCEIYKRRKKRWVLLYSL